MGEESTLEKLWQLPWAHPDRVHRSQTIYSCLWVVKTADCDVSTVMPTVIADCDMPTVILTV